MERDATQTLLTENMYLNGRKLQLNRFLIIYMSYMLTKWSKKNHISVYFTTKRAIISGFIADGHHNEASDLNITFLNRY